MKPFKLSVVAFLIWMQSFAQNNVFPTPSGSVGIGTTTPGEKLEIRGSIFINQENSGLIVDEAGNRRIGFMKYLGRVAGIWRTTNQDFEIGRVNVTSLPGTPSSFTTDLFINSSGNVGIGSTNPLSKLEIKGSSLGSTIGDKISLLSLSNGGGSGGNDCYINLFSHRSSAGNEWQSASTRLQCVIDATSMGYIEFNPPGPWEGKYGLAIGTGANTELMRFNANGNISIGTTCATEKLTVNGNILSRKVKVNQSTWCDYVFHPTYQLPSLKEVEAYIKEHQHLPEIPSAKEVEEKGLDLGDNQAALLKKIEELTLYMIEMKKENEQMKRDIEKQNTQIKTLQKINKPVI